LLKSVCERIRVNLEEAGHPGVAAPCLDKPNDCGDLASEVIAAGSEATIG